MPAALCIFRKKNEATTVYFPLVDAGSADDEFEATPVAFVAGDSQYSGAGAPFGNTNSLPTHEGLGIYSLALTAAEMNFNHVIVTIIDTAVKLWKDQAIIVRTMAVDEDDLVRSTTPANTLTVNTSGQVPVSGFANDAITAAAIAANAIGASELAADAATEIADAILSRDIDNVEATAAIHSLCTAILRAVARVRDNAGTMEIYRTNGTVIHASKALTTDAAAVPVDEEGTAS